MIFKWANAILNDEFLSTIPSNTDHNNFFTTVAKECGLLFKRVEETKIELQGSWQNVIKAEELLQKRLLEWKRAEEKFSHDNSTQAVVVNNNVEVLDDIYDGNRGVNVIVSHKETEDSFHTAVSRYLDQQMFLVNYKEKGTSDIKKIGEKLQPNKGNCANNLLVEKEQSIEKRNGEKDVEELYMNITVSSKSLQNRERSTIRWDESEREDGENPLDKLCQLLQIDEEEGKEKRLLEASRKQKYEDSLPFKFFCSQCSFKTKRESHYLKHVRLHDKPQKTFMCSQCDFKTIRLSTLRKHEVIHNTQKLLNCEMCSYKTDDSKLLNKHLQTKHVHKCNHCDFIAHSLKEARKHFHITHKPNKTPSLWKCEKCPYKSRLRAHLRRHMNDAHGSLRPFLCQYCGKCFKRHETLKQHKVSHGEVNPSHTCSQCNKVCCSASQLKEHMSVHTALRPFLCEHCGVSFKTKSIQRKHIRTLHSVQTQFQCNLCSRSFRGKTNLMRHMKTHRVKPSEEILQLEIPEIAICETSNQDNIPVVLEINNTPLKIEVLYSKIGAILPKEKES